MDTNEFERLCDLLPLDVNWGDTLTPQIMQAIKAAVVAARPASAPAVPVAGVLENVREWIDAAPHGDNCFLHDSGEYASCYCGKDSILSYIDSELEAAPAVPVGDGWEQLRAIVAKAKKLKCWMDVPHDLHGAIDEMFAVIAAAPASPAATGWVPWMDCPVPADTRVTIKQRNGVEQTGEACDFVWSSIRHQPEHEVIAWKLATGPHMGADNWLKMFPAPSVDGEG